MSVELSTMAERYDASRWKFLTNVVHNSYLLFVVRPKEIPSGFFVPSFPVPIDASSVPKRMEIPLDKFFKKNAEWMKEWRWMEVYIYESGWKLHLIRIFKKFYWNVWNCHFFFLPLYQSSARCWLINNNNNRLWIHWNPFTRRTLLFQKRAMHFVPHFKR